jgi:hypothetical protein
MQKTLEGADVATQLSRQQAQLCMRLQAVYYYAFAGHLLTDFRPRLQVFTC